VSETIVFVPGGKKVGVLLKDSKGYFCNLLCETRCYSEKVRLIGIYGIDKTFTFSDLLKKADGLNNADY